MSSPPPDDQRPPPPAPPAPAGPVAGWAPTELIPRPRRVPGGGNALPVGTRLGEFEVQRVIGEGGFGIVYLAHDLQLQRRVAIKEYMPSSLAQRAEGLSVVVTSERHRAVFDAGLSGFLNEARLLAQFDHPSLVKVFRFWQANGTAYMVMPFYEGATLKETLRRLGGPPDERWLMALLAPLTEALSVIHAEHCLHRDIAPDNILLLAGSGRPLLLDFGAARQVIGDATQALTAILKPGYAPVEQYAEVPAFKQGPWTDVYALCAVVYAAVMGAKPPVSVARTMADSCVALTRSAAGRYSPRFLQAIDDGLKVKPNERTPSIAALRQALGMDGGAQAAASLLEPLPPATAQPAAVAPSPLPAVAAAAAKARPAPTAAGPALARGPILVLALAAVLAAAVGLLWMRARPAAAPAPAAAATPGAAAPTAAPAPAPAPLPGPAPQALPTTLSIDAEFNRIVQAQRADFGVQASPERARLRIGRDRLAFKLSAARDGHVYVLVGGPDGSLMLLYPNTMADKNHIRAGQTLNLPQPSWPLETSEPAGTEQFIVIVSQHPRDFSQLSRERDVWFLKLPTGSAGAAALRGHAGPGSALAGTALCQTPGCDHYGAARFEVEVVK